MGRMLWQGVHSAILLGTGWRAYFVYRRRGAKRSRVRSLEFVTDPSGAVVVGANVTAVNTATSLKTAVQTNASGVYTIRFLPVGTYNFDDRGGWVYDPEGFPLCA
jgi:hypothetical protein